MSAGSNAGTPESPHPDYVGLVKFLISPFLESPDALSVDCEISAQQSRFWVRVAFQGADKGRVFGRGGRNIQAIRTVLKAVAEAADHSAYLDIYDSQDEGDRESEVEGKPVASKPTPRPTPKPRT